MGILKVGLWFFLLEVGVLKKGRKRAEAASLWLKFEINMDFCHYYFTFRHFFHFWQENVGQGEL